MNAITNTAATESSDNQLLRCHLLSVTRFRSIVLDQHARNTTL